MYQVHIWFPADRDRVQEEEKKEKDQRKEKKEEKSYSTHVHIYHIILTVLIRAEQAGARQDPKIKE